VNTTNFGERPFMFPVPGYCEGTLRFRLDDTGAERRANHSIKKIGSTD
jgi:hypothetical protein